MPKNKTPSMITVPAPDERPATARAEAYGHVLGQFEKNGDVWIASCVHCKDMAVLHKDCAPTGVATTHPCRQPQGALADERKNKKKA